MTPKFQILSASANMPLSCWGKYRRIALVEVDPAALAAEGLSQPRMISARARGVVRVVCTWEKLHCGKGIRDAYSRARAAAEALAAELEGARA